MVQLLARPRAFLLSVLLLTNLANVAYFVAGAVLERRLGSDMLGVALNAFLVLTLVVGADLMPKLLARTHRVAFCRVAAGLLEAARDAVVPLTRSLEVLLIEPVMRLVRPVGGRRERALSKEELGALLDLSARTGALGADEQRLLGDVVDLGATRIREIMTPRVAMAWLEEGANQARVREVALASGLRQLPVFRGSLDGRLLGMLELRRYLPAAEGDAKGPRVADYLAAALCVPERAKLDQLLTQLAGQKAEAAICVDEFGAVVGFVRAEDIAARLLYSGSDAAVAEEQGIEPQGEGLWTVPGRLPAREMADYFLGEDAPEHRAPAASTVGGLFFARLGRVPRTGDTIALGNVRLEVVAMSGRAVDRVQVSVLEEAS